MKKIKSGFSLVEIVAVLGVITVLAAISIPNLLKAKITANDATAQAVLKSIANALENYVAINSVYPNSTTLLMGAQPPYLSVDYFSAPYAGFTYTPVIAEYSYDITAVPTTMGQTGTASYTISTGGSLQKN